MILDLLSGLHMGMIRPLAIITIREPSASVQVYTVQPRASGGPTRKGHLHSHASILGRSSHQIDFCFHPSI